MAQWKGIYGVLAVLLIFPSLVDFLVWVYNVPSPSLGGLPFFWWFQIFWLGFSVVPYAAYAILANRDEDQSTPASGEMP